MKERIFRSAGALGATFGIAGCSRAPSISIVGSFFPVWMLCLIAGVVAAAFARAALLRWQLEEEVGPLWLFYTAVVILMACVLWLIFFQ